VTWPPAALLVAALAVGCVGCPRKRPDAAAELARVEYARRTFRSSLAGCTDPVAHVPIACVQLEVDYVELTRASAPLAAAVAAFVGSTALRPTAESGPAASVEALRDDLYDRYRAQQRETPGYQTPWIEQRSITVACNTDRVLALEAALRASTGGGDASERVEYRTFDIRTGAPIRLDDIVVAELQPDLEQAVRGRLDTRPEGALFERRPGSDRAEGWVDPEAVLICPDTLTVQWHDDGATTTLELPRDEVKAFLGPDAP
jgi:hypothetical protein